MAVDCLKLLTSYKKIKVLLVIGNKKETPDPKRISNHCKKHSIEYRTTQTLDDPEIIGKLIKHQPDYIFNINSFLIIKKTIIGIPKKGIINFHNGPLPRYRGLNVCSWAIINGESKYGVTWHQVTEKIDAGDVIAQKFFSIEPNETAISLIMRCIVEGTLVFKMLIPDLISGKINSKPQNKSKASYFSRHDRPYGGLFPFFASPQRLKNLIRGITFHPIQNTFYFPKCYINKQYFFVEDFYLKKQKNHHYTPGTVLSIGERGIDVACKNSIITFTSLFKETNEPLKLSKAITAYSIRKSLVITGAQR